MENNNQNEIEIPLPTNIKQPLHTLINTRLNTVQDCYQYKHVDEARELL